MTTTGRDLAAAIGLRRLVERATAPLPGPGDPVAQPCELCSEPLPDDHRHLFDTDTGELLCCCRACSILFDRREADGNHYRLVPDRHLQIPDTVFTDAEWASLRIPVDMAFFVRRSEDGTAALYPGAMGAVEAALDDDRWQNVLDANPILRSLEVDVEALLVNRTDDRREQWVVPIDTCFTLVAIIRTHWRGLSGGTEVWEKIEAFFTELRRRSTTAGKDTLDELLGDFG